MDNTNKSSCCPNTIEAVKTPFHWHDRAVWKQSAINTLWCLLGCVIGDFGAILWFQTYSPETAPLIVMSVAIVCGITTSIILETILLSRNANKCRL